MGGWEAHIHQTVTPPPFLRHPTRLNLCAHSGIGCSDPMMNQRARFNFLLEVFLTRSTVVADDATGNKTAAAARRTASIQLHASATEAASATTPGTNQPPSPTLTHPLPPVVTALKFPAFFRQPIGPRGLESIEKLRRLEGGRIQIPGCLAKPSARMNGAARGTTRTDALRSCQSFSAVRLDCDGSSSSSCGRTGGRG